MDDETRDLLLSLKATIEGNQPPPFLQSLAKVYVPLLIVLISAVMYANSIENKYNEERALVKQEIKEVNSELSHAKRQTNFNFTSIHTFLEKEHAERTLTLIRVE